MTPRVGDVVIQLPEGIDSSEYLVYRVRGIQVDCVSLGDQAGFISTPGENLKVVRLAYYLDANTHKPNADPT